jgi:F-type H+-transporting ATPase subunit b
MSVRSAGAAALALLLSALPARAAEGGGGPFEGNVGNALWTLVIFGLVVFVLGRYAWKPILSGLASREAFIRASLESAKRDRDEAEARLKEYAEKLVEARSEATAIVEEARRDAEAARHKLDEEAREEVAALFERAKREIGIAQEDATQQLYALAAQLSTQIAAKVLRREINPQDHERLIRESIDRLGRTEN